MYKTMCDRESHGYYREYLLCHSKYSFCHSEYSSCHSERSEESHIYHILQNRESYNRHCEERSNEAISLITDCHEFTIVNSRNDDLKYIIESNFINSPSLAEGVRGWVESTKDSNNTETTRYYNDTELKIDSRHTESKRDSSNAKLAKDSNNTKSQTDSKSITKRCFATAQHDTNRNCHEFTNADSKKNTIESNCTDCHEVVPTSRNDDLESKTTNYHNNAMESKTINSYNDKIESQTTNYRNNAMESKITNYHNNNDDLAYYSKTTKKSKLDSQTADSINNKNYISHSFNTTKNALTKIKYNNKTSNLKRTNMPKYQPKTKKELEKLVDDESVYLGDIDTSLITDMSWLFKYSQRQDFSGIESWNVSNVKNMRGMFDNAESFNHKIESWNVANVENMEGMFHLADVFNQPLDKWNVSKVENMEGMFCYAQSFNQPLESWNVSKVKNMNAMFAGAQSFNQNMESWNISQVKDMKNMFRDTKSFNKQNIESWNLKKNDLIEMGLDSNNKKE